MVLLLGMSGSIGESISCRLYPVPGCFRSVSEKFFGINWNSNEERHRLGILFQNPLLFSYSLQKNFVGEVGVSGGTARVRFMLFGLCLAMAGCSGQKPAPPASQDIDPADYRLEIEQPSSSAKFKKSEKFKCVMRITLPEKGSLPDTITVWFERNGAEGDSWSKPLNKSDPAVSQTFKMELVAPRQPGKYQLKARANYFLDEYNNKHSINSVKVVAPSIEAEVR